MLERTVSLDQQGALLLIMQVVLTRQMRQLAEKVNVLLFAFLAMLFSGLFVVALFVTGLVIAGIFGVVKAIVKSRSSHRSVSDNEIDE